MSAGTGGRERGEGFDFSDLRAVFVNCTLKRSPEQSHTAGLMAVSTAIMRRHGVATMDDFLLTKLD